MWFNYLVMEKINRFHKPSPGAPSGDFPPFSITTPCYLFKVKTSLSLSECVTH